MTKSFLFSAEGGLCSGPVEAWPELGRRGSCEEAVQEQCGLSQAEAGRGQKGLALGKFGFGWSFGLSHDINYFAGFEDITSPYPDVKLYRNFRFLPKTGKGKTNLIQNFLRYFSIFSF